MGCFPLHPLHPLPPPPPPPPLLLLPLLLCTITHSLALPSQLREQQQIVTDQHTHSPAHTHTHTPSVLKLLVSFMVSHINQSRDMMTFYVPFFSLTLSLLFLASSTVSPLFSLFSSSLSSLLFFFSSPLLSSPLLSSLLFSSLLFSSLFSSLLFFSLIDIFCLLSPFYSLPFCSLLLFSESPSIIFSFLFFCSPFTPLPLGSFYFSSPLRTTFPLHLFLLLYVAPSYLKSSTFIFYSLLLSTNTYTHTYTQNIAKSTCVTYLQPKKDQVTVAAYYSHYYVL